jgi:hypothetical protein
MKRSKIKLSVLFAVLALAVAFVSFKVLHADTSSNGYGYAWSSNIGWIKLNDCDNVADDSTCTPSASYGVTVLPSAPGTITGYAWSPNVGWITFNNSGCPTTGCTAGAYADWTNVSNNVVTIHGWARACSVYASGCSGVLKDNSYLGNWDGYIALDSVTAGGTGGTWGLAINADKTITGYAWGSEVIGWIKGITTAIYGGPVVKIVPNPARITSGASSTLTVTASNITNANACTIANVAGLTMAQGSGVWTGTVSVSPTQTTPYTVTCTNGNQQAKASTTVYVTYFITQGACSSNNLPTLAWDTDATSCSITKQGGGTVYVDGSSKAYGAPPSSDGSGSYFASINLPIDGQSATYNLQCTDGARPNLQTVVNSCQQDYSIGATAISPTFTVPQGGDGKTMTATYSITITPQRGFVSPVTLSVISYPPTMPKSTTFTFSPNPATWTGNTYNVSTLTITVNTADLKKAGAYSPIVIQGVGNGITRTAQVTANSAVKITPVFKEF